MDAEVLKGHLDLLLLAMLQTQPGHGYAVAERLRRQSSGTFDLPEGTLYPALHRLERAGLLRSRWSDESGRKRRIYQLTAKGQRRLSSKQQEWRQFADAVHAVVGA
jgi:PadR family transcriptional regulator, regulatory protein PadR